jgi:hypothetical protein
VHRSEVAQQEQVVGAQDKEQPKNPCRDKEKAGFESPRKRKSNADGSRLDLNVLVQEGVVPTGLVHDRLAHLGTALG